MMNRKDFDRAMCGMKLLQENLWKGCSYSVVWCTDKNVEMPDDVADHLRCPNESMINEGVSMLF